MYKHASIHIKTHRLGYSLKQMIDPSVLHQQGETLSNSYGASPKERILPAVSAAPLSLRARAAGGWLMKDFRC